MAKTAQLTVTDQGLVVELRYNNRIRKEFVSKIPKEQRSYEGGKWTFTGSAREQAVSTLRAFGFDLKESDRQEPSVVLPLTEPAPTASNPPQEHKLSENQTAYKRISLP
jgi:hypothetical protein